MTHQWFEDEERISQAIEELLLPILDTRQEMDRCFGVERASLCPGKVPRIQIHYTRVM